MKKLSEIVEIIRNKKPYYKQKYGLNTLAIFGSYARNENTAISDIDILVDFERPIGIEFIDFANELEKLLLLKVDLISRKGVKANYLKAIENDLNYV